MSVGLRVRSLPWLLRATILAGGLGLLCALWVGASSGSVARAAIAFSIVFLVWMTIIVATQLRAFRRGWTQPPESGEAE